MTEVGAKKFLPLLSQDAFIVRDCFAALAMTAWGETSSCVSSLSTFNFQFSTKKRKGCPLLSSLTQMYQISLLSFETDNYFWWGIGTHFQSEGFCCFATIIGDGVADKGFA
jgi:hypothetical protein